MPSKKTHVIELIFESLYDPKTRALSRRVVTQNDVKEAIARFNLQEAAAGRSTLSDRNIPNFFKDFVRKRSRFLANWPASVSQNGYSGRQLTGGGNSFEFVQASEVDLGEAKYPVSDSDCVFYEVQTVELPPAIRRLVRRDENWLLQLIVRLNLVETHLAIASRKAVQHLSFLQMGIKQATTEIDAMYLAEMAHLSESRKALVTVEAKGLKDDILETQVVRQVQAALRMKEFAEIDLIIPLATKAIGQSRIYIAEYAYMRRLRKGGVVVMPSAVRLVREAVYALKPPIVGL